MRRALLSLLALLTLALPGSAQKPGPPASVTAARRLASLPLIEVPATLPGRDEMAVLLSGDGGWAVTDRGLSKALAQAGIPVIGWNSLHYFLTAKSPDVAAHDLELILRRYLGHWHRQKAVLIGYSFGADVMPFLAARLPPDLARRVSLIALLGPSGKADFRFHLAEWLGKESKDSLPVLPELERLHGTPLLCAYGTEEKNSLCPQLPPGMADLLLRPGGHVIDKNYGPIAAWILRRRSSR
jgi:type IV secretory pathway VirJ component